LQAQNIWPYVLAGARWQRRPETKQTAATLLLSSINIWAFLAPTSRACKTIKINENPMVFAINWKLKTQRIWFCNNTENPVWFGGNKFNWSWRFPARGNPTSPRAADSDDSCARRERARPKSGEEKRERAKNVDVAAHVFFVFFSLVECRWRKKRSKGDRLKRRVHELLGHAPASTIIAQLAHITHLLFGRIWPNSSGDWTRKNTRGLEWWGKKIAHTAAHTHTHTDTRPASKTVSPSFPFFFVGHLFTPFSRAMFRAFSRPAQPHASQGQFEAIPVGQHKFKLSASTLFRPFQRLENNTIIGSVGTAARWDRNRERTIGVGRKRQEQKATALVH